MLVLFGDVPSVSVRVVMRWAVLGKATLPTWASHFVTGCMFAVSCCEVLVPKVSMVLPAAQRRTTEVQC